MEQQIERQTGVCQVTSGNWPDEESAAAELDRRLDFSGLFKVEKEVIGQYIIGLGIQKTPRIDRLLLPSRELVKAGWDYGAIGIECKVSGKKLGTIVAQCQDYSRAIFTTPSFRIEVKCSWIFIWPLDSFFGDIASIMTQNKIGGVCENYGSGLRFKTACGNLLSISDGKGNFTVGRIAAGNKIGSR